MRPTRRRRTTTAATAWLATAALAAVFGTPALAASSPQLPRDPWSALKKGKEVVDNLRISDADEERIGAAVSEKVRARYGVVQDPAVHRYVSLVGTLLGQASTRPTLQWKFIVLDTDGVNAFAAPGGYVHITRGALALLASESELASVLAHELIHVTEKHTIRAIQKGKAIQMGANETMAGDSPLFGRVVDAATEVVMAGFGRDDELEADQKGLRLVNAVGYAPAGLPDFLTRLADRNKGSSTSQGLFASHPAIQERIDKLRKQIGSEHLGAKVVLDTRYRGTISYRPTPQSEIAVVVEGAAGLTGDEKKPDTKKEEAPPPKKKGFSLGGLLAPGPSDKKGTETTASAAARGMDRERNAKGGPVTTIVVVTVTAADLAAFKKEGGLG